MKKQLLMLVGLFLSFQIAKSQITLLPSTVNFTIMTIELYPVDDYTNGKQYIGLFGDKGRLDILWDARYNPEILDPINVTCWLNCESNVDATQCYGLQNCSFHGETGAAACTIFDPNYNYSSINTITCRFSNPNYPYLEYRLADGKYPQRVFYPIRYSVSASGGTYLVGRVIPLPITFVSYSFLKGNYTALLYVPQQSFVIIDNTHNTTSILGYSQADTVYPKVTVIYAGGKTYLYVNTTANELPSCNSDTDCPSKEVVIQGTVNEVRCIQNKCQYTFVSEISSAYLSLPEYGRKEAILIVFLALLIFFLLLKLGRGYVIERS